MKNETRLNIRPSLNPAKCGVYKRYIKWPMDFILSLFAIIILSPIFLIVAVLVKVKIGSPVIFKQKRPGLNEKIFTLYKFKTMTDEKDENGELASDEIRLTQFGKFLRSTSLDELPQLWNIVRGDMAVVGPRPLLVQYLPYYTEIERCRYDTRPGLTGLAQVSGRNLLAWDDRLAKDVEYVHQISFVNDLCIIFKTVLKVLKKQDALTNTSQIEGNLAEIRQKENDLATK